MAGRIINIKNPRAWAEIIEGKREAIATAYAAALRQTANNIVREGRFNIQIAGRFGRNWVQGLQDRFEGLQGGKTLPNAKAIIFHRYAIATVFEHGATIQGKPLLWIPTKRGMPPPSKSGKKLVYANLHGQPVLFDAADRARDRKPIYIGIPTARIRKRWHIFEIAKKNVAKLQALFNGYLKD